MIRHLRSILSVGCVCVIAPVLAMAISGSQSETAKARILSGPADTSNTGDMAKTVKLDLGKGVTMDLVLVPAGEFMMGNPLPAAEMAKRYGGDKDSYKEEYPRHRVHITHPFYMAKYEVTVGQFKRFVEDTNYVTDAAKGTKDLEDGKKGGHVTDTNGPAEGWGEDATFLKPGFKQTDGHPVVMVSWNDASAFCKWLAKRSGRSVRLPTEAEWEYACRGGTDTTYWWGNQEDSSGKVANLLDEAATAKWPPAPGKHGMPMKDGYLYTSPVGKFKPNAFGLYDMIGNACEWCGDWGSLYANSTVSDPTGPIKGEYRVVRGGCWASCASGCYCSMRGGDKPGYRDDSDGFRIAAGE
jgi:formylglycine-generating enzyme